MLFCILFAASVIGLLFIAATIRSNKVLQTHPQTMIAWICLAEACMSYNALIEVLNPVAVICYFGTYRLLALTYFEIEDFTNNNPLQMEYLANQQCQSN